MFLVFQIAAWIVQGKCVKFLQKSLPNVEKPETQIPKEKVISR